MTGQIATVARYVLTEDRRSALPWLAAASVVVALGLAGFLSRVAITEAAALQASVCAALLRACAVFLVAAHVAASVVREANDKGLELALALPISRPAWYLGKLLGFAATGALIAALFALPLLAWSKSGDLAAWWLALAAEAAVVAAAALTASACALGREAPMTDTTGARLVVLGIAQDGGMPHMGCETGPCAAARRGERRAEKVACLGLAVGARAFVFDATPDFPAQVHAMGVRLPDGVFLTHAHIGHYAGLVHLGKEVLGARGVPLYATPKMHAFLAANAPWRALVENGNVEPRPDDDVELEDGVRVTAFQVPHRN
jgi:hypothetical protein